MTAFRSGDCFTPPLLPSCLAANWRPAMSSSSRNCTRNSPVDFSNSSSFSAIPPYGSNRQMSGCCVSGNAKVCSRSLISTRNDCGRPLPLRKSMVTGIWKTRACRLRAIAFASRRRSRSSRSRRSSRKRGSTGARACRPTGRKTSPCAPGFVGDGWARSCVMTLRSWFSAT